MYITEVKALYIVKGGIAIERTLGGHILNLFVVFVVTSCTGPAVQSLQVAYLLAKWAQFPGNPSQLVFRFFQPSYEEPRRAPISDLFHPILRGYSHFYSHLHWIYTQQIWNGSFWISYSRNHKSWRQLFPDCSRREGHLLNPGTLWIPESSDFRRRHPNLFLWHFRSDLHIFHLRSDDYLTDSSDYLFCAHSKVNEEKVNEQYDEEVAETAELAVVGAGETFQKTTVCFNESLWTFHLYELLIKCSSPFSRLIRNLIIDYTSTFSINVKSGCVFSCVFLETVIFRWSRGEETLNGYITKPIIALLFSKTETIIFQFIFPFLTIHIPFYTAFILPYLDLEFTTLSSNLPYLFAWCPAINPILVICMVKVSG